MIVFFFRKRGKPTRIKKVVFEWILIEGRIVIIADTTARLRKEHTHK